MHPYRTPKDQPTIPRWRWWAWVVCLFTGHRWKITRTSPTKAVALAEFHPLAGHDAICMRCGKQWLDAEDPYFRTKGFEHDGFP